MFIMIVVEAVISPVVVAVVEDGNPPQNIEMGEATVAEENAQILIITGKGGNKVHRIITLEEATSRLIGKILINKHRVG